MSWLSKITGRDAARNRQTSSNAWWQQNAGGNPNDLYNKAIIDESKGGGWQKAFNDTAGAFLSNQMPGFLDSLQMTREQGQRRGIGTGDLGTSNEGDLTSAFQRNISNALGGLAMQGYENNRNRYLDLLSGRLDRNQSAQNARNNMWASGISTAASPFSFSFGGGAR